MCIRSVTLNNQQRKVKEEDFEVVHEGGTNTNWRVEDEFG